MSAPESTGSGSNPDLFTSLRTFWGVIVAILYTRLDLATLELEEEATRALHLVVMTMAALMAIVITIFFVLFLIVAIFWDNYLYRLWVLGLVSGFCAISSVILVGVVKQMIRTRPKFLSQTIAELRKDAEGLRPAVKVEEPKP